MKNKTKIISSMIINANKKPFIIIIHWLFTLISVIGIVITGVIQVFDHNKNLSDIKVTCISSTMSPSKEMENIRFGVHNYSEDAKELTKAKLYISKYRDDNTNEFVSYCKTVQEGVSVIIYNSGWRDLSDITFSISKDSDFSNNLKDKSKFTHSIKNLKHGEECELGVLTTEDLFDKTKESPIVINCTIPKDNDIYESSCQYHYDQYSDKLIVLGKGSGPEKYDINYCIDTSLEVCSYEIPISYYCPPNGYEEINFSLSADRSCHIRYYIEFYVLDKIVFKTDEKGTNIKIDSKYGSPIKNTN